MQHEATQEDEPGLTTADQAEAYLARVGHQRYDRPTGELPIFTPAPEPYDFEYYTTGPVPQRLPHPRPRRKWRTLLAQLSRKGS